CQGAERRVVWDDARRRTIEAAFTRSGRPWAGDLFHFVDETITGYQREWSAMRVDACEATRVRGEQSEELLDLKNACLDERYAELQAYVELVSRGGASITERAAQAVPALPELLRCADVQGLRTGAPLNPESRARLIAQRGRLAQAR